MASVAMMRFSMDLFRATTRHGSMVIIINVDEEQRIVSSVSFMMKRGIICCVHMCANVECRVYVSCRLAECQSLVS